MTRSKPADGPWIRECLERFEAPLIRYAQRFAGDIELARDAVQETFLKLCDQEREKVEPHLKAWLFTVCRNGVLDHLRRQKRMSAIEDEATRLASDEPQPGARMEQEETVSKVLATLDRLPSRQAEVLRLKFQQGLSYKEISQVMETSMGNVGFLIHHGLKSLRQNLAGKELEGFAQ